MFCIIKNAYINACFCHGADKFHNFDGFTFRILKETKKNIAVLAVDGADIQIAANPGDTMSYHPGINGKSPVIFSI